MPQGRRNLKSILADLVYRLSSSTARSRPSQARLLSVQSIIPLVALLIEESVNGVNFGPLEFIQLEREESQLT